MSFALSEIVQYIDWMQCATVNVCILGRGPHIHLPSAPLCKAAGTAPEEAQQIVLEQGCLQEACEPMLNSLHAKLTIQEKSHLSRAMLIHKPAEV